MGQRLQSHLALWRTLYGRSTFSAGTGVQIRPVRILVSRTQRLQRLLLSVYCAMISCLPPMLC